MQGGGVLGTPPRIDQGMPHQTPSTSDSADSHCHEFSSRSPPLPKMKFPKFDGENPRLWHGQCEIYFKVYFGESPLEDPVCGVEFHGRNSTLVVDSIAHQGPFHKLGSTLNNGV